MKRNLIKAAALSAFIIAGSSAFAETGVIYISPNNDGIQDTLEVPLKVKEKRYIKEWSFIISNEAGEVVRTIGNKVALPTKINFKSFMKALGTIKTGVDIPSVIVWNGFLDDGTVAPDGNYFYEFAATDDNGNAARTAKLPVVVDNTPPEINLSKLAGNDKTFGEGSKATLKIRQSGSLEKLWTAQITDAQGKEIRSYKWENASPVDVEWNGTDETKFIVPDGAYNYEITSTDLAGNKSEVAVINNIIFSAEKPEVAVTINGSRFFAPVPAGKTKYDAKLVKFNVAIPSPTASVNSLTDWSIEVIEKDSEKVVWSKAGKSNPPSKFEYDGKDNDGNPVEEGEYRTRVKARYLNGYEATPSVSPVFVLDNHAPKATIALPSNTTFNGDKNFVIDQTCISEPSWSGEKEWTGRIVAENGKTVKTFEFGNDLPSSVEWDGYADNGDFAADGKYRYMVDVVELAGNTDTFESAKEIVLDTSATELALSVSPQAFAPAGNSPAKTVTLKPLVNAESGIASYEMVILDGSRNVVFKKSGEGSVPSSVVWNGMNDDGTRCAEGIYTAAISTVAVSGTKADALSASFIIDNTPPSVEINADYILFSPEETSSKQTVPVKIVSSSEETKWTADIRDANNAVVKSFVWNNSQVQDFEWDGKNANGDVVANGKYSLMVYSTDAAGNSGSAAIAGITVDARPVSSLVTAELAGISPNGDNNLETQDFDIRLGLKEGISSWTFDVIDSNGTSVKTFSSADNAALPAQIKWAGETNEGTVAEGIFSGKLRVEYAKGNVTESESSKFICTATPPQLTVKTAPKYFSPDNDGEDDDLFIQLKYQTLANLKNWSFVIKDRNNKQFWKTSGKSKMTERLVWDGRGNNGELVQSAEDYPYVFTVTDDLGMTSVVEGMINIDILVVRDGDKLKMQIPSIIFRSNEADFVVQTLDKDGNVIKPGITKAQAENNERVLKRVAEVLKKFGDYKITVVGHANRTSDNPDEETVTNEKQWGKALIDLSRDRAEFVKDQISKKGIAKNRLSAEGKGGTEPVADRKDRDVNWKNRRVEFILEK